MNARNSELNSKIDPLEHLGRLLEPTGLSISDTGGEVKITGEDPLFCQGRDRPRTRPVVTDNGRYVIYALKMFGDG